MKNPLNKLILPSKNNYRIRPNKCIVHLQKHENGRGAHKRLNITFLEWGVLNKTIAINYGADNANDKYAVAVKFNRSVVAHVPREISKRTLFFS